MIRAMVFDPSTGSGHRLDGTRHCCGTGWCRRSGSKHSPTPASPSNCVPTLSAKPKWWERGNAPLLRHRRKGGVRGTDGRDDQPRHAPECSGRSAEPDRPDPGDDGQPRLGWASVHPQPTGQDSLPAATVGGARDGRTHRRGWRDRHNYRAVGSERRSHSAGGRIEHLQSYGVGGPKRDDAACKRSVRTKEYAP